MDTSSVLFRPVPSCSVLFRHCSVLFRHVPSCSVMFRHVPSCSVMFRHVPSCSVMFRHDPSCSVMFRHVPSCSVMFHQAPRRLTWISRSSNPGRPGWTPAAPLNNAPEIPQFCQDSRCRTLLISNPSQLGDKTRQWGNTPHAQKGLGL